VNIAVQTPVSIPVSAEMRSFLCQAVQLFRNSHRHELSVRMHARSPTADPDRRPGIECTRTRRHATDPGRPMEVCHVEATRTVRSVTRAGATKRAGTTKGNRTDGSKPTRTVQPTRIVQRIRTVKRIRTAKPTRIVGQGAVRQPAGSIERRETCGPRQGPVSRPGAARHDPAWWVGKWRHRAARRGRGFGGPWHRPGSR